MEEKSQTQQQNEKSQNNTPRIERW